MVSQSLFLFYKPEIYVFIKHSLYLKDKVCPDSGIILTYRTGWAEHRHTGAMHSWLTLSGQGGEQEAGARKCGQNKQDSSQYFASERVTNIHWLQPSCCELWVWGSVSLYFWVLQILIWQHMSLSLWHARHTWLNNNQSRITTGHQ